MRLQGHPVCGSPFIVVLEDPTPAAVSLGGLAPSEASASSAFCCSMQSGETWPAAAAALDISTVFQGLRIGGGAAAAKPRCKKRGKPSTTATATSSSSSVRHNNSPNRSATGPALHLFSAWQLPVAPSSFALSPLTSSEEPHNNHDGGVFVFGASVHK